jgi:hypothetical protein
MRRRVEKRSARLCDHVEENVSEAVATSFDGLDPGSRLRIRIFAFKLLIIIPVSVALAMHLGHPLLGTLAFFCFWHSFLPEQRRGFAIKGMALRC